MLTTCSLSTAAPDLPLPAPQKTGGQPLMLALAGRHSSRQFANRDLDQQTLANLLWAANGFNRADKRTAPSAKNQQEIDVYVFLKTGAYFYDARANALILRAAGDHRKTAGTQEFVATAPVNLVLVANLDKAASREMAHADCGFISQNVYLYCASENLATVVRAGVDKKALAELLKLSDKQEALYNQPIGYPPVP
ncbi:MAG: SagB/ThcOx family dehydrogenase [Verrucomicrobiales bacterium]|nr:SagB/ThcOx family dehydrogenase [Verrucomicrobiales bacterium]